MDIIVSFSGGKDSTATLVYALEYANKHGHTVIPVYQDTGFEHPALYEYLEYIEAELGVTVNRVRSHLYNDVPHLAESKTILPNSLMRSCTSELKIKSMRNFLIQHNFHNRDCEVWMGIRASESTSRNRRYSDITPEDTFTLFSLGSRYEKKEMRHINVRYPIVDYTEDDVWELLNNNNIATNPLYTAGFNRVGCFPCVLSGRPNWVKVYQDPNGKENMQRLAEVEDYVNRNKEKPVYFTAVPEGLHQFIADIEAGQWDHKLDEEDEPVQCHWCHS